ncbi:hypothetical protein LH935_18010 [Gordonia polyisoprenivorans]|uniref:hypothetical protein n=1 Tax=Gordonia polyisoprenivorans TaxID=84595 RepID=UPI0022347AC7|nr:hypothetical protein [uncultured Gordonia sp.]UZF54628.1 hypothetical protein LH935_18010 [Gordonia polyisoprenivorans]
MAEPAWDLTQHVRGALAEALVAEAVHLLDQDAVVHKPRHPGYDVESIARDMRVDAKVARLLDADTDGTGPRACVEWDAGRRGYLVAEGVTHLGFAVLRDDTSCRLVTSEPGVLQGVTRVSGDVFLVPAHVVDESARPIWAKKYDRPSSGSYRYLRVRVIEQYRVEFRHR